MNFLTGKWKIVAHSPLGDMALTADFVVDESTSTFTGSVYDEGNKKTYGVSNGVINDHHISYDMLIKFGLIPFSFHLEGDFKDDGTCTGEAKAMKMTGTYEGYKVVE